MEIDRRTALLGSLAAAGFASRAAGQPPQPAETIELWPRGAPGMPAKPPVERIDERSQDPGFHDRAVLGIARPRMTVFRPARPNGAAVLIMPGGGYSWVVVDKEGNELGAWLAARGVTAFVLFYRLPGEGWAAGPDTPLQDAQRAMRLIRARAEAYRLDPARVAAMGFSAGGHLCADLATRFAAPVYQPTDTADALSARPVAAAPIYPVIAMTAPLAHPGSRRNLVGEHASAERERAHSPHLAVTADTPPCFLLHAEDDNVVPVENSLLLRAALRARGVPVETHLFPDGGHGFGLRLARGRSVEGWQELFWAWGAKRRLFA
ncbi:MAG: alpha/beta hydrolase [Alphaproteobacteria bacterium]|nr:alpha/beta hydrolase [Alphaproteobacteria bacterium]